MGIGRSNSRRVAGTRGKGDGRQVNGTWGKGISGQVSGARGKDISVQVSGAHSEDGGRPVASVWGECDDWRVPGKCGKGKDSSEVQNEVIIMRHQISSCHVPVVGSFFIL